MNESISISPSTLSFDWVGCKRDFWISYNAPEYAPPIYKTPAIFPIIDEAEKEAFANLYFDELDPSFPAGKVIYSQKHIQSTPVTIEGFTFIISGYFDSVLEMRDGTYGVVDYKTTLPDKESQGLYAHQLQAYAYVLEHPAPTSLSLKPISITGLITYNPTDRLTIEKFPECHLDGKMYWVTMPYSEKEFLQFMGEVVAVLRLPEPPEPDPDCKLCLYREKVRGIKW